MNMARESSLESNSVMGNMRPPRSWVPGLLAFRSSLLLGASFFFVSLRAKSAVCGRLRSSRIEWVELSRLSGSVDVIDRCLDVAVGGANATPFSLADELSSVDHWFSSSNDSSSFRRERQQQQ